MSQTFDIQTDRKPTNISVSLTVPRPSKIRIACIDPNKAYTVYNDRWSNIKKGGHFEIRMPQSPENCMVLVSNLSDPNQNSVHVTEIKKIPLKQYLPCYSGNPEIKVFVKLAQEFSENATILDTGTYYSDNGKYRIDYLPVIFDKGIALDTPARISNTTGRMEVSKKFFSKYTVPMRMAILLHEFSHFNLNKVQTDEIEADLNALKIYMGLGYPIIEAHKSFLNVFKNTPTDSNVERYEYLKTFIDNFDTMKYQICN